MRESVAGAWVEGERAVVHLTNASERFDVGIVRVRRERIDEEENRATFVGGDHGADLLVAAERATRDLTRDLEAELLLERVTGRAGRGDLHGLEEVAVLSDEIHHRWLHFVVRNERDEFRVLPLVCLDHTLHEPFEPGFLEFLWDCHLLFTLFFW